MHFHLAVASFHHTLLSIQFVHNENMLMTVGKGVREMQYQLSQEGNSKLPGKTTMGN